MFDAAVAQFVNERFLGRIYSHLELFQGRKFIDRFDAVSYVKITEQMDTHDVGRDRGGVKTALATIRSRSGLLPLFIFPLLFAFVVYFVCPFIDSKPTYYPYIYCI